MSIKLQCQCGSLSGQLNEVRPKKVNRLVCYCDDCQAFAHFLKRGTDVLDEYGGTDIAQMSPAHIEIKEGTEHLACMRMSDAGIFRWYAACCNTPIGNTGGLNTPFLGLIHGAVVSTEDTEAIFGPIATRVQTKFSKGGDLGDDGFPFRVILTFMSIMLKGKLSAAHAKGPFFDVAAKSPVVTPTVLSKGERTELLASF